MKFYARVKDEKIVQGYCLDDNSVEALEGEMDPEEFLVECLEMPDPMLFYFDGSGIIQKPVCPGPGYFWDDSTKVFVYDTQTGFSELRSERNHRLSLCDWTQAPDAPVDAQAWATYRQALRDLPANTTDPRDVAWPEEP